MSTLLYRQSRRYKMLVRQPVQQVVILQNTAAEASINDDIVEDLVDSLCRVSVHHRLVIARRPHTMFRRRSPSRPLGVLWRRSQWISTKRRACAVGTASFRFTAVQCGRDLTVVLLDSFRGCVTLYSYQQPFTIHNNHLRAHDELSLFVHVSIPYKQLGYR